MKKILSLIFVLFAVSAFLFAEEEADEYDDGYVYEANGAGDQYLLIGLMPFIPLNFGDNIYVGGAAEIGYYRFITRHIAGNNSLTTVPISFGGVYQFEIGKFEVPVSLSAGIAYETAQNSSYFPGFVLKTGVGCVYRLSELWSFGAECKAMWLPQWFSNPEYNYDAFFLAPAIVARYHF